jgi:mycothiol synthase
MSDSLRLSVPDLEDPRAAAEFYRVADAALDVDGYDPFNEQARLDVAAGRRTPIVATAWSQDQHGRAVGAAILGRGELDLVIDPVFRGKGFGAAAIRGLLPNAPGEVTAWSHGDHPAAHVLAPRFDFVAARTLLQLRLEGIAEADADTGAGGGESFPTFQMGTDEAEWVELNSRIFAFHPEQGSVTIDDLRDREAEEWFEASDFLIARDDEGRMIGYNWLKVEQGNPDGEIYVVGVDSEAAGRGLGRRLMRAGLARLRERGCTVATLYVEADNDPAVRLYRSLGFLEHTVDVQYRREASAP